VQFLSKAERRALAGTRLPAITLWQPSATFVLLGLKTIETRTHDRFKGLVGRRIAIHAGKNADWKQCSNSILNALEVLPLEAVLDLPDDLGDYPRGRVLCLATVAWGRWLTDTDNASALCDCAEHFGRRFGIGLADVAALPKPVPAKGRQGIWMWNCEEAP